MDKLYRELPQEHIDHSNLILGNILVITEDYLHYDFMTWQECANFLIDKCYGLKRAMTLVEKTKEHLVMRCPLTGEDIEVLGSSHDLECIHTNFILQNLYRHNKRSSHQPS